MSQSLKPKVWSRFEGKTSDGDVMKIRIQDVSKHRKNDAIDLFIQHFIFEEALSKACLLEYENNEYVKSELSKRWRKYLEETELPIAVCCFDESDVGELMGVSISDLLTREECSKDDDAGQDMDDGLKNRKYAKYLREEKVPEIKKIIEVTYSIHYKYEPFEIYPDINSYLDDLGIVVLPKYRGLGVGSQFIKCRRLQAKALNADMTGAWMTSLATQRAAERDGWEVAAEFFYVDLEEEYGIRFDDGLPPSAKVMAVKV